MRNTHDIAIELERILEKQFGYPFAHSGTIFSADFIELAMFYDDMHLMLHIKGHGDWIGFINEIYQYKGMNMNKIPNVEEIWAQFKTFIS